MRARPFGEQERVICRGIIRESIIPDMASKEVFGTVSRGCQKWSVVGPFATFHDAVVPLRWHPGLQFLALSSWVGGRLSYSS